MAATVKQTSENCFLDLQILEIRCGILLPDRILQMLNLNPATAVTVGSDFYSNRYYLHLRSCNLTCSVDSWFLHTSQQQILTVISRHFCYTVADPYYILSADMSVTQQQIILLHSTSVILPRTLSSRCKSVCEFVSTYDLLSNGSFNSKRFRLPDCLFGADKIIFSIFIFYA